MRLENRVVKLEAQNDVQSATATIEPPPILSAGAWLYMSNPDKFESELTAEQRAEIDAVERWSNKYRRV